MISKLISSSSIIDKLYNSIENSEKITIFGCDLDAKLTLLKESGKSIFFVANDIKDAVGIKDRFVECGYRVEMLMEKLDYKLSPFQAEYNQLVVNTLSKLLAKEIDVLIVNPMFLKYKLPKVDWLSEKIFNISKNQHIDMNKIIENLIKIGFERSVLPQVNQFDVKGDMIEVCFKDIALRIYFDFDEIAAIKTFDIETRINDKEIQEYSIYPNNWFENIENSINKIKDENLLEQINNYNSKLNNILWFMPFANNVGDSIFDYLDDDFIMSIVDNKSTYDYLEEETKNLVKSFKEEPYILSENIVLENSLNEVKIPILGFQYITNQNRLFNSDRVFNIKTIPVSNYLSNSKLLAVDLAQSIIKDYTSIVYCKDSDGVKKISTLLDANLVKYNVCSNLIDISSKVVNLIPKKNGCSINLEVEKILIIGHNKIWGKTKPILKKNVSQSFDGFLPESGDYVVHTTHGIGKCVGVECLQLSTAKRDYVIIEYQNNDRLYLPVENIDLIDKYVGDSNPKLHKLGGTEFLKTKEKIRHKVKDLAINLACLYAERNNLKGHIYNQDDEIMRDFEESFGYVETPDQLQAIEDVKADMVKGKVVDRLICGDVGFGKTEVALRIAFKTILGGRQVAFLCPTTILSQQHYNTAISRMKNFGVNIKVINRFCTTKELNEISDGVKNGEIDILIGTQKILNDKLKFKNLGLLVLDEEQKFGVGDKEKIKNLKKNINVLTLSATPIPRTLNMSLTGIRDISVIETPPVSRIPTIVKVCEYSEDVIKTAINNELNRDGQVLIVYNRVESIYEFAKSIKKLYPNETIDVAHGQMEQKKLEDAIFKLYNNETKILISTTLIENGVDLPNANTLVVVNSDKLGLSQLYQLKGRVGRSDKQAFAYFTYDNNKFLTDTALKRLEAITEYTSMGSGFKIALKDLEIRGAGSIFGAEQSGHIEKVGYAMYLKLLSEAVKEIKGEKIESKGEVKVETSLNGYIPNDYIVDYNQRMSVYLRISKINSTSKLFETISQLGETYGDVPEEVVNLCKIAIIKNLADKYNISKVVIKNKDSGIYFKGIPEAKILDGLDNFKDFLVLDNKNLPIIMARRIYELNKLMDLYINFLEFISI